LLISRFVYYKGSVGCIGGSSAKLGVGSGWNLACGKAGERKKGRRGASVNVAAPSLDRIRDPRGPITKIEGTVKLISDRQYLYSKPGTLGAGGGGLRPLNRVGSTHRKKRAKKGGHRKESARNKKTVVFENWEKEKGGKFAEEQTTNWGVNNGPDLGEKKSWGD